MLTSIANSIDLSISRDRKSKLKLKSSVGVTEINIINELNSKSNFKKIKKMSTIRKSSILLFVCLITQCFITLTKAQYSVCNTMEEGVEYLGNELAYSYNANSSKMCASLCASIPSCSGFTFWNMAPKNSVHLTFCSLKNFTTNPVRNPSANRNHQTV